MACCAFAVMLLMQLLAPLRVAAGWFGMTPVLRPDAAVLWEPGVMGAATRRRPPWRHVLVGVLAFDLMLLALFRMTNAGDAIPRVAAQGSDAAVLEQLIHQSICGQPDRRP